ncbi:TPR_REGION domain-containing protein [Paraburkholderia tropica]|uniref:tetratricopeptide repeat protein n=1 Tax=Paraburkholderia tropica TaxID=92647 RepID=UPI001CB6685C|nr:tetratricopeptide repeat protein [Paraburkholderia tropica]CAG9188964.1 TPR_REGION domain-containing protein [Paraburkholderia tropica]
MNDPHSTDSTLSPALPSALPINEATAADLHRHALAAFRAGETARARDTLERALHLAPGDTTLWEHRGLIAALAGEHLVAEACYRRALSLSGGTASQHRNLADVLKLAGRADEACEHYRQALACDPRLRHAARRLGDLHQEAGRIDEAAQALRHAWSLDDATQQDGVDLLNALARLAPAPETEIDALIAAYRARFASDAVALKELAFALNGLDRFADALDVARQGLAIDATLPLLHHNAAYALHMQGDHAGMRRHNVEAARLAPNEANIQFNLAISLLRDGEYEAGWKQYRWHERLAHNRTLAQPPFPEWQGEPVDGRRFLLLGEQGLGDQVQLLRGADWLARRGAIVDVWVDAALVGIASRARGVHRASAALPPGPYDYWCRMFRMPERMAMTLDTLPGAMPYLHAEPDAVARWSDRLDAAAPRRPGRLRVGLVWAGNPGYDLDRYRSMKLAALLPAMLPSLGGAAVSWFALQKGAAERELAALPAGIDMTALGPEIATFDDTLAIAQSLDLVLTVDTSVAHLAGGAGVPVWVMLPLCTDWRWMCDRADSPWYPSARLFRQRELGNWDDVVEAVRVACVTLLALAAQR